MLKTLLLFLIITLVYKLTPQSLFDYSFFVYLEQYLTIALITVIFVLLEQGFSRKHQAKMPLPQFFYCNIVSLKTLVLSLVILILMQPINYYISQLTNLFFEPEMINDYENNSTFMAGLLNIALMPAICEELLFRGALLRYQTANKNTFSTADVWRIILFNGFLFGLFHLNISQFFYTFFMGSLFALITLKTRSLFPVIMIHFFSNLLSTLQPEEQAFPSFSYLVYFEEIDSLRFNLIFVVSAMLLYFVINQLDYKKTKKWQGRELDKHS